MPMEWVEPQQAGFLTYKGEEHVVYVTYKDGNANAPRSYWFTLDSCERDACEWDIRVLFGRASHIGSRDPLRLLQEELDCGNVELIGHEYEELDVLMPVRVVAG